MYKQNPVKVKKERKNNYKHFQNKKNAWLFIKSIAKQIIYEFLKTNFKTKQFVKIFFFSKTTEH